MAVFTFVLAGIRTKSLKIQVRSCGREAEGGGLLNRYRVVKPYRGFESLRLRQYSDYVSDLVVYFKDGWLLTTSLPTTIYLPSLYKDKGSVKDARGLSKHSSKHHS